MQPHLADIWHLLWLAAAGACMNNDVYTCNKKTMMKLMSVTIVISVTVIMTHGDDADRIATLITVKLLRSAHDEQGA